MASLAAAGGEVSIRVPAVAADPAQGLSRVRRRRKSVASKQERMLNGFIRFVAAGEWAGNAFGTLAFLWGTVVLLGEKDLKSEFWYATATIFIEAFRMFSRNYRLDDQSLFRTTRAIRAISSPFVRMLVRPQEWNELAAIMGFSIYLVTFFPELPFKFVLNMVIAVLMIFMSKLQFPGALQLMSRPRRYRRLLLWVFLAALLIIAAALIWVLVNLATACQGKVPRWLWDVIYLNVAVCAFQLAAILAQIVAVLLLNFRPPSIANLTDIPCGRKLLSLVKVILVMSWLGFLVVFYIIPVTAPDLNMALVFISLMGVPLTTLVLSLGSLQTPAKGSSSQLTDIALHICFFGQLLYMLSIRVPSELVVIAVVVVLLIGNLQIPAAVAPVVISSWRLGSLSDNKYDETLVKSVMFFYVLTLCQGTLYIVACISHLFSFFLRRSLASQSGLRGKRGSRAVDLYYHCAYLKCMETGILAAGKEISLASFSIKSLSSGSHKEQLAGVLILDSLLQQREELVSRIACSSKAVSALIGMLGWTNVQDEDIRLFAARVTAKLAGSLRVAATPGVLKLISSLLDAEDQPAIGFSTKDAGGSKSPGSAEIKRRRHDIYVRLISPVPKGPKAHGP